MVLATYGADGETIYASGIVPGLSEDSGTCTLTASGASGPVSASAPAHAAGGSVNCGRITVPVSVGTWSITLRYTSPDASGESAPTEVVIG
ncbi:hypothetical protein RR49_02360 [Microbacterium ginsengisoli]|uniref:Uncharacterized protein n=1 Tax=Microbacterium ginsengisoli TaxID=400772 RepID=A0A0F0LVZ1_9MICO|nr:hypothetical protein RR49_02360 [Microbacterium ginsengisoli]